MVLKSAKLVKQLTAICCAGVMAASAAACGANTDTRTQITVWSWEPSMKQVIAGFEKDNPDIRVVLEEHQRLRQTQQRHPRRLRHSRRGAAGILRIAPVRGQQPARAHHRQNRRLCRFYTPGTWASVQLNGRVYGLPMDSGPMAFFYNNSVFEQVGVDASKIRTWDDYYEAAEKNSRKSACTSPPIPATPASTTR